MANPFEQFLNAVNPFKQFAAQPESGPQAIATTKDGGQVFRMADGNLSFKSPGYATNDQTAIARIMEGATPLDEAQRSTDQMTISQNPIAARVQELNQGAALVGEWLDNAVGMVSPTAGRAMQQTSDAMERQNPGESLGLNIVGGIAYSAPALIAAAPAKAADWVAKGATRATQALRAFTAAAPAGAVEGASSFAGRADSGGRAEAAGVGALVGGALAGALSAFAPALSEGAAALARRIKKLDVSVIADEFGLSAPAARVVRRYLMADDLDAAANVLARGGDDAMLANAGPATRQALDTAASTGGEALSIARGRVGDAVNTAGQKFVKVVDDILGTADGGIKGAAKAISKGTAAIRKAAYDYTYAQPTPMAGEAGAKLQSVLARISPDDLKAAIKEANAEILDSGYQNQNIMASVAPDGSVTFTQPLSVLQLDYIARGLSNVVEGGTDKMTGALSPAARRAQGQMRDLRGVLKTDVQGYATALKLGGDAAQQREALSIGRSLLNEKTTVEDVRTFLKSASSDEAKAALRKGLRENLDAIMGRARTTIGDLESGALDLATGQNAAAESIAALRTLLSRNNLTKARFALGSDATRLFSEIEKMGDVLVLRAAVAKGSATAIRRAGQEQMAQEVAPGIVRRTIGNLGNPFDAAKELTQGAVGTDARTIGDQEAKYFAEIADALTRIRGPEALRALQTVRQAMAGQPMKDADAQAIGRLLSGGVAVSGYQGLKQPQSRK